MVNIVTFRLERPISECGPHVNGLSSSGARLNWATEGLTAT
jgi:hypothetical protein